METEIKHLQFKFPYTCLISGPTGSGKTIFIRRKLKNFKHLLSNFNQPILKVLWAYGVWNPLLDVPISENVITQYVNDIPSNDLIEEFKPNLIVIDDLLNEFDKNKDLENLFIKKSHHLNISVIFSVQNLFHKTIRTISLNAHYIILMKNPRDGVQVLNLARQIYPDKPKLITEAYKDATKQAYGYLIIDLKPDTPEFLRLKTRIMPEEVEHLNKSFSPIIYKSK